MKKNKIILAATMLIFVAALLLSRNSYLVLSDTDTGKIYQKFGTDEVVTFEIEFIHSVNKTPVADIYTIEDETIILSATRYRGFGAGVPTELEGEQVLTYDNEGNMIITGYNLRLDNVHYIVGTVYDHILKINEKETINLTQLCGKNANVTFEVKKLFPWQ